MNQPQVYESASISDFSNMATFHAGFELYVVFGHDEIC